MILTEITSQSRGVDLTREMIEQNCAQLIKSFGGWDKLVKRYSDSYMIPLRGMNNSYPSIIKPVRKDRLPSDSDTGSHREANEAFVDKFDFPYRTSSLFTTTKNQFARGYGNAVYAILPIGTHKVCYSPEIADLYNEVLETADRKTEAEEDVAYDVVAKGQYRETNDLQSACIDSDGNEMMIACDKYFAIRTDSLKEIFSALK